MSAPDEITGRVIEGGFRSVKEGHGVISDPDPKVPEGVYALAFVDYKTALMHGRAAKLGLRFQIIDQGPHYGTKLLRWYNLKRLIGQPQKNGNFQIGRHSDFLREYLNLFPDAVKRLDRISMRPFGQHVLKGRIKTVTKNSRQQKLPELMEYSVICELLETD